MTIPEIKDSSVNEFSNDSGLLPQLDDRILILDGAMGTMIQRYSLTEEDFRGDLPIGDGIKVKGCNDLLVLTRPDVIGEIHDAYIAAGADIIETDSFNANEISMREYGMEGRIEEINQAAARVARECADAELSRSGRKVYVAGSMGPSNVALTVPDTTTRAGGVTFDSMRNAYQRQADALIKGGVDMLMLETIFDTLNAKAAIAGVRDAIDAHMELTGIEIPLMLSVTLTEQGRTLSGQTVEAFLASVRHARPVSIGLNCGFGAEEMGEWLEKLQGEACYVSLHPNAGLPDELGRYTSTPASMAATMERYMAAGYLNIAGGCCGTTPDHIRAIADVAGNYSPRRMPEQQADTLSLSGLERKDIDSSSGFVKVGERCNVAGSRKFLRLVNEGNLPEALGIAVGQIGKGAAVLDINMDDALLDAPAEMERFVMLLGADRETSALPVMIDSSDMNVIRRALCRIQGRPVVNSISLKEGEEAMLANAREIRRLGGAVVVMAFDEEGQATTFERKIEICERCYRLLTEKAGFSGSDIVFDPNILTIATGVAEHDRYGLDFLKAVEWIKQNLPGAKVSGGISNLSFAFRGQNAIREAMHTVFLHHAILRGMDMAIVNPSTSLDIATIPMELREAVEDVIFCRRPDATDRLLGIASEMRIAAEEEKKRKAGEPTLIVPKKEKTLTLDDLIEKGMDAGLKDLLDKALEEDGSAMRVVKERLMAAMQRVGDEFGAGRMFLPQVVRSASVMKKAIEYLTPALEKEAAENPQEGGGEVFILATVKGDVHDIGKNIVGVILRCSGFEVIDLGVMVSGEKIVEAIKATGARFVGLSGLITPSLAEMCSVAELLEKEGLTDVILCVGGATTSDLHTAVKIAPLYSGVTLHTRDAARLAPLAARLTDRLTRDKLISQLNEAEEKLREEYAAKENVRRSIAESAPASGGEEIVLSPLPDPRIPGTTDLKIPVRDVVGLVNRRMLLHTWGLRNANMELQQEERDRLLADADEMLAAMVEKDLYLDARVVISPACRRDDDIVILNPEGQEILIPTLRRNAAPRLAMADFLLRDNDWIGLFAVTARNIVEAFPKAGDDYRDLLLQSLADRLVEAATERMHTIAHEQLYGLATPRAIRPAIGYPSLPDQTLVFEADKLLHYRDLGISLTENGALSPSATTTGLIFSHPEARYFEVDAQSEEQIATYASRRGIPAERMRMILPK